MGIAHSWLMNKIITLSVSLHLPYMVKHKVLLDKRRSVDRCPFSLWAPDYLQPLLLCYGLAGLAAIAMISISLRENRKSSSTSFWSWNWHGKSELAIGKLYRLRQYHHSPRESRKLCLHIVNFTQPCQGICSDMLPCSSSMDTYLPTSSPDQE